VEGFAADNVHHRASVQIVEFFCVRHDEVSLAPTGMLKAAALMSVSPSEVDW